MNSQESILYRLEESIKVYTQKLDTFSDSSTSIKPSPTKWSKKEELGHLVDSSIVNYRRFIRAEINNSMIFDGYDQDQWVILQGYQFMSFSSIRLSWLTNNFLIKRLLQNLNLEYFNTLYDRHTLDQVGFKKLSFHQPTTMSYFVNDYIDHMIHHLERITK